MHIRRFSLLTFICLLCLPAFSQIDFGKENPDVDEAYLQSKQYRRMLDNRLKRDPAGVRNMDWARWQAWEKMQGSAKTAGQAAWENFGPDTVSGRIIAIDFHPTDSNTFLVGAASGGLWRTTDYGMSWTCLTDDYPTMGVGAVKYNPQNPNTILIATGEGYGFGGEFTAGFGVLISYDAGQTWSLTSLQADLSQNFAGMDIAWNWNDTNKVCVATSFSVYYSGDGGHNYNPRLAKLSARMISDPQNPDTLYLITRYYNATYPGGFYRSFDSGQNWTQVTNGGLPPDAEIGYSSIDVHPVHRNIIYLAISKSSVLGTGPMHGIYKSIDYGATFSNVPATTDIFCYHPPYQNICLGWYANTIKMDPVDTNIVYAGGTRMRKSIDGGINWNFCDIDSGAGYYSIHPDHHQTVFHPITGDLIDCNDGGVKYSTNGAGHWNEISDGLVTHQFYSIGFAETNSDVVVGGCQDVGTFTTKTAHSGGGWNNDFSGDSFGHLIDHQDEDTWYGTAYINMQRVKTTDAGANWLQINTGTSGDDQWRMPMAMHPTNNQILFSSNDNYIYRTTNGGALWTAVAGTGFIGNFAFDQIDHDIVYANELWGQDVYRSTDGGLTWYQLPQGPGPTLTDLATDPWDMGTVYATNGSFGLQAQVYKSTNMGLSWTNISSNLPEIPANTIVVDPFDNTNIYVGTDLGVWLSEDGGASWQGFNDDLPNVVVEDIHYYKGDSSIRIGTYGRGYWKSPAAPVPVGVDEVEPAVHAQVFPNPASDQATLRLYAETAGTVKVQIFNSAGALVKEFGFEAGTGNVERQLDLAGLAAGIYGLRVSAGGGSRMLRLAVWR